METNGYITRGILEAQDMHERAMFFSSLSTATQLSLMVQAGVRHGAIAEHFARNGAPISSAVIDRYLINKAAKQKKPRRTNGK